ncbi:MAG TPA: bifunctional glutamate N-acetyltransferase/amino-acid acetyltransferase ArgJ [Tepidisphaeraceae bacterium]|jgi:glutamate N-acetyltransferase/amino-acid N-acetyltransferase|nr:bifunctional glutamate N-acetyltransferase/amino-acid acetyltransferase ArgJ [Tepidisphaeraceae bacterium]
MPQLHLLSPKGFRAAGVAAGIKSKKNAKDVALLVAEQLSPAAAVFTTNKVFAAPVKIGREHVAGGELRGVVVNAGNANACTGRQGEKDARRMCALSADLVGAAATEMLPCSTGIIGHLMPMPKVERGIRAAAKALGTSREHAVSFSDAILTTDLVRKEAAIESKRTKKFRIAGVCKGSGMIGPRMSLHATMLAFITTDAAVPVPLLNNVLQYATERSFNAVTVDDHTSTNDTGVVIASGASDASIESPREINYFRDALTEVCESLAYQIAKDGEGATKVVAINVSGATSETDARIIARAIANSPLVKCAMHGNDPNWGRIVSAAGLAGVPFNPDKCSLKLQGTTVFRAGQPVKFDANKVSKSMAAKEVRVDLTCSAGKGQATCWTCDLSKGYITINADYHT